MGRDRGVEIHTLLFGIERQQKRVSNRKVATILSSVVLPPATDWIDGNVVAMRELGPGSSPLVLVK